MHVHYNKYAMSSASAMNTPHEARCNSHVNEFNK